LKQTHPHEYGRVQNSCSFYYYALEKDDAWDIYANDEDYHTGEHKHTVLCKIKKNPNNYTILKPDGKPLIESIYIIDFEKNFDDKGYSDSCFYDDEYLRCFDGLNFLSIGLETMEVKKRKITDKDAEYLIERFDGDQIWNIINNLKKQNKIVEVNQFVNGTWYYFFNEKKDWETARRILFFVKPDNMEGLDNDYESYRAYIGETLRMQENHEDAVEFHEEAIRLNPDKEDSTKNWYNWRCGDGYYALKNYQKALHHFEEALKLEPDDQWLLNRKGNALYCLGRYNESISCYTMAIEKKREAAFYNNRGNAYKALSMQDKADADYREAKKYE
jgi:tetratricopeptide (TPR) repeat protein